MKKALVILLALFMVGVVFAEEPKAELVLAKFSGNAALLFGADLDSGSAAFGNEANVNFVVNIVGKGDKASAGEGVWGELVIKTDGDEARIKSDRDPTEGTDVAAFEGNLKFKLDKAQLNFPNGYIGIKKDGTNVDFVQFADKACAYWTVDQTARYGKREKDDPWLSDAGGTGANAAYGFVFDYQVPEVVELKLDLRSFAKLSTDGASVGDDAAIKDQIDVDEGLLENAFGIRVKAIVLAVENLTLEAAVSTGFGGDSAKYDLGLGAKLGYKVAIDDTYYVKPTAAINALMDNAAGADGVSADEGTEDFGFVAHAGVLFGWGAKQKAPNVFFTKDKDHDWGYYPGIGVGMTLTSEDFNGGTNDQFIGMNVSLMTGSLIENLVFGTALEIDNVTDSDVSKMGFLADAKYTMAMGEQNIVPKFGFNYFSDAALDDDPATDMYVKVGMDIENIFPNCTLSFEYHSNDLQGGVAESGDDTMGLFFTKFKIAF